MSFESIIGKVVDGAVSWKEAELTGPSIPVSAPEKNVEPTNAGQQAGPQVKSDSEFILNKNHMVMGGLALAAVVGLVVALK